MRLKKIEKKIVAGLIATTLVVSTVANVKNVKASETEIPFAQNEDGTYHENSFDLARESDDDSLSSYEEDNGKHWVKLFSTFDGTKNIFDHEEMPDDTAKLKVVFDITNYDLDKAYPLTWATGIGGWTSNKPTGVTIDQNGTYEAVLDIASETDGIGRTISAQDIATASIQLVFQLGEADQENIANVKKIRIAFQACYAYEESDDVVAAPVIPIKEETATPTPVSTATPAPTATVTPDESANQGASATKSPSATVAPANDNPSTDMPVSEVSKVNKVTKLKAAKKTVTIKKGRKKTVIFKIKTKIKNQKTTDKITKVAISDKKVAKIMKKSLGKKKCSIQLKGLKKGKTTLTVKVGKKKAKVKIKVA